MSVLRAFHFPVAFIRFVRILYKDTFVIVNFGEGIASRILIEKRVKQGDPMASLVYVLCIEALFLNLTAKLSASKLSPFVDDPLTNLSAYAVDTNVFISDTAQFQIIQDEFSLFGLYSAAILNLSKCEVFLFGSRAAKTIISPYKIASQNIRILGIEFGCNDTNWSRVLSNMKSKIAHYKSTYKDSSLLFKAKVLNEFG